MLLLSIMPYCTNRTLILHQLQSPIALSNVLQANVLLRTSRFLGDFVGLCKAVSMEGVVGRMAAESTKRFEVMDEVLLWIHHESVQTY